MIRKLTLVLCRGLSGAVVVGTLVGTVCLDTWAQQSSFSSTQTAPKPRSWASLTPAQQTALQPLQEEWDGIDFARKGKWIEIADRFPTLPPVERARIQGRMTEWAQLSPRERGQTRLNFKEAQQIAPQDRKARWEAYNALSPEERQQLAARAAPASAPTVHVRPSRDTAAGKSNTVPTAVPVRPRAVAPSVAQAQPGATTILVTRRPTPPAHQQGGLPKIVTSASLVDNMTLLPKGRAQQSTSAVSPAASAPAASRP
jgi:hypothetical protein